MMTINQLIVNLTIIILLIVLYFYARDFFRSHERCIDTYVNAFKLIAISGWVIHLASYKVAQPNLPALMLLIVLLFQIFRYRNNIK
ncbi:hypothetical protein DM558_07655 [Entomomonas moraniae]|uniref:Uncharacterized protein n=1 Tax=Entomomonas moraniae TaxID=2213226 RepID=A0A3Q9JLP1_9GAMM|nr:hypothetical protein DM558_07655 [Entomomonas moraniae]